MDEGWHVELDGADRAEIEAILDTRDDSAPALAVYTGSTDDIGPDRLPIVGGVEIIDSRVRWHPRYSLLEGQHYTAVWRPIAAERPVVVTFTVPRRARERR